MAKKKDDGAVAVRATVRGAVQGVGFRDSDAEPGATSWACWAGCATGRRARCSSTPRAPSPRSRRCSPSSARDRRPRGSPRWRVESVKVEGHEQFAIRGVSAGVFVVQEHAATARHFDLRLEVDGVMRSWAVPKGPSMDPAVKRLAVQVEDHALSHNDFEGPTDGGGVIVWDRGSYEQGGRVPWPEALERGHAVFVLHGEKLRGGFALQRTRPGEKPQWLLIKRRDEQAQPGSDVVAERPESVLSGGSLDELLTEQAD